MAKVAYVGPYEEGVDLVLPSGASKHCKKNEPVEIPGGEFHKNLLVQDIWENPKGSHKSSEPAPATQEKE